MKQTLKKGKIHNSQLFETWMTTFNDCCHLKFEKVCLGIVKIQIRKYIIFSEDVIYKNDFLYYNSEVCLQSYKFIKLFI